MDGRVRQGQSVTHHGQDDASTAKVAEPFKHHHHRQAQRDLMLPHSSDIDGCIHREDNDAERDYTGHGRVTINVCGPLASLRGTGASCPWAKGIFSPTRKYEMMTQNDDDDDGQKRGCKRVRWVHAPSLASLIHTGTVQTGGESAAAASSSPISFSYCLSSSTVSSPTPHPMYSDIATRDSQRPPWPPQGGRQSGPHGAPDASGLSVAPLREVE